MTTPYFCSPNCPTKASGNCYNYHKCRCETCKRVNRELVNAARAKRDPSTLPPEAHGKASTYTNWKCRCDLCKEAGTKANRTNVVAFRERQKALPEPAPPGHGKAAYYSTYGCRCSECREAALAKERDLRRRKREGA